MTENKRTTFVTVVAWRDCGDGYPNGVVIYGINGEIGPEDAIEIQKAMNDDVYGVGVQIPTDPYNGVVGVECEVWYDDMWTWDIVGIKVDYWESSSVAYKTVEEYTDAVEGEYISIIRKADHRPAFVAFDDVFVVVRMEREILPEFYEYRGINYVIHLDPLNNDNGWVITERVSGQRMLDNKRFADQVRAEAACRDTIDEKGVLEMFRQILYGYEFSKTCPMISLDEYNKRKSGGD